MKKPFVIVNIGHPSKMGRLVAVMVAIAALTALFCTIGAQSDDRDYSRTLRDLGYPVQSEAMETADVVLPETFGAVFSRYNDLQKQAGYDLTPYAGCHCIRYTYAIDGWDARGNLLVYDGRVIGGDICSVRLDGFMLPLIPCETKDGG